MKLADLAIQHAPFCAGGGRQGQSIQPGKKRTCICHCFESRRDPYWWERK